MNQITANGITYNIVCRRNADDMEACGFKNTARTMRENGIAYDLILQRPRGKKFYAIVQYTNGSCSAVMTL
jgi:hypothetical protein